MRTSEKLIVIILMYYTGWFLVINEKTRAEVTTIVETVHAEQVRIKDGLVHGEETLLHVVAHSLSNCLAAYALIIGFIMVISPTKNQPNNKSAPWDPV